MSNNTRRETICREIDSASSDRTLAIRVLVRKTYGRDCGKRESSKGTPQFMDNRRRETKDIRQKTKEKNQESRTQNQELAEEGRWAGAFGGLRGGGSDVQLLLGCFGRVVAATAAGLVCIGRTENYELV